MKKKILFIVNPISGTANKKQILATLEKNLNKDLYEWEVAYTEYAGHARLLASDAVKKGIDIVTAIGGDGTVNEVGSSLVNTDTALGIIPCGSGNGLARHLGIPVNAKRAADVFNNGVIVDMDYGLINGKPFFCTCGVGFDANVSYKFAQTGKRGFIKYMQLTVKEGLKYKSEHYTVEDDKGNVYEDTFYLVTCGNASQYGNNFFVTPHAVMNDGLLDVTILKPFPLVDSPQVIYQMFNRKIGNNKRSTLIRTTKLHIHRDEPGVMHYDGDPVIGPADIDIEVVRHGIKMVVFKDKPTVPESNSAVKSTKPIQITQDQLQKLKKK
ncbi:MAG: diacylglycerol kinase family lipid kinase [Bacteroidaceae bacterium]|nr:diacylglycerol kinase family lipid kinase [Bacteroidaceae bacterium]